MAPIDLQQLEALADNPTVCDGKLSLSEEELFRGISSIRDLLTGVTSFETMTLLPCSLVLLLVVVVLTLVSLCCCVLCRRRHAYIKLEDDQATPGSPQKEPLQRAAAPQPFPWSMPFVPRLESVPANSPPTKAISASSAKSDSHQQKQPHSGHLSVKPPLPAFDPLLDAKERVVGYRTFMLPLPSLRSPLRRVKGAVADGLSGLKRTVTPRKAEPPQMPGSNAYPYAATILKLDGAPEPDDPDSARSGGSTFRQSSARWRAYDREVIDDSAHLERIKSARGRTPTSSGAKKKKPTPGPNASSTSG